MTKTKAAEALKEMELADFEAYLTIKRSLKLLDAVEAGTHIVMPTRLTAENGAKAALIGEFHIPYETYDEDTETMVRCKHQVEWTMIKDIYCAIVNHFIAAPDWEG